MSTKEQATKEQVFEKAKQQQLWAGHLIAADNLSEATLDNYTPIDNSVIGQIASGTSDDVDIAVKIARDSFENGEWRRLAPAERKVIVQRWCTLMHEHSEELAALDCVDAGKPITECLNTDIPATIETFEWYAEAADKVFGKVSPTGSAALGLIVQEPIGVLCKSPLVSLVQYCLGTSQPKCMHGKSPLLLLWVTLSLLNQLS